MQNGGLRKRNIRKVSKYGKPLLSVITVVYNGAKTLEQTIQSVINQTYDNIEYIIIDGASSDGTIEIIKKYEYAIDYWQSEPDKGIYDAMNKGINLASGDYIALLNADDWYEFDACEKISKEILRETFDVYYGVIKYIDENGRILRVEGFTTLLLSQGMIAHPTCFISKEIYSSHKYDTNYKSASDYDFVNRLVKDGASFCFIPEILVNFRIGGMSSNKIGILESLQIQLKNKYISYFKFILKYIFTFLRP